MVNFISEYGTVILLIGLSIIVIILDIYVVEHWFKGSNTRKKKIQDINRNVYQKNK